MDMEQFHKNRLTGIGGSDAPQVCGVSPYGGPSKVYMQKVGLEGPTEANVRMEAGTRMEGSIAKWFADDRQVRVEKPEEMIRHPKYPWMTCHLDGVIYDGSEAPIGILEVKNVGLDMAYLWGDVDDAIPESIIIQCQHNLLVASCHYGVEFEHCDVAALIGGNDPRFNLKVPRDPEMIKALIKLEDDFWHNHVEPKIPPPIDGLAGSAELLAKLHPYSNELVVNANGETNEIAGRLLDIRAQLKTLTETKTLCENGIKEALGDAGIMETDFGKFSWKRSKDGVKTDWKALANSVGFSPEQLAEFSVDKQGVRRFLCPRGK